MPIDHTASHASDHVPSLGGHAPDMEAGDDATLRLLRSCVEAMGLLQAKVEGFDGLVAAAQAETGKEFGGLRVEFAGVLGTQSRDGARLTELEAQVGRMQASQAELAKRFADDLAGARTEAAHWRMRVETDAMAFDQLSTRIAALEEGTLAKLQAAEQRVQQRDDTLAERTEENTRLKSETRVVEAASDRLRQQLATLEATIADQRARIGCLQNKLATSAYAARIDTLTRDMAGAEPPERPDILDLVPLSHGKGRTTAA